MPRLDVRQRLAVWRDVLWAPWKAVVLALYGIVTALEWARDKWASPELKSRLEFIPDLTWQGWLIGVLALAFIVTLEGAYRVVKCSESAGASGDNATSTFSDVADLLANRLARFVGERRAGTPVPGELDRAARSALRAMPGAEARKIEHELGAPARAYHSRTIDLYDARFAQEVITVRRALTERGLSTAGLETYPRDLKDIEGISAALSTAAQQLRDSGGRADAIRHLTQQQRIAIKQVLRHYPRPAGEEFQQHRYFTIFAVPGVEGAGELAADLRSVFGEAGFDAQMLAGELPGVRDMSRFRYGVWLRGDDALYAGYETTTRSVVIAALEAASIDVKTVDEDCRMVQLVVGSPRT